MAAMATGAAQREGGPAGIRVPFGGTPSTGNPTPGTPQPDPPNLADRVTFTGCVEAVKANAGAGSETHDPNVPTDSRFVLTNAERQNIVPSGTGGSPFATNTSSRTFRLEAIESQLSVFTGTKVEVSGQIRPPSATPPSGANSNPTLQVEFVQKIAQTCR
jgi:hypothetical protein